MEGPETLFRSVAKASRVLGIAEITLYRAIKAGKFPAVRVSGRILVPAKAIEEMAAAALNGWTLVDAASWVNEARHALAQQ